MKKTSLEQRRKIQELVSLGKTSAKIAEELGITIRTVSKWRSRIKKGVR